MHIPPFKSSSPIQGPAPEQDPGHAAFVSTQPSLNAPMLGSASFTNVKDALLTATGQQFLQNLAKIYAGM